MAVKHKTLVNFNPPESNHIMIREHHSVSKAGISVIPRALCVGYSLEVATREGADVISSEIRWFHSREYSAHNAVFIEVLWGRLGRVLNVCVW